jgi:hypothetical protein
MATTKVTQNLIADDAVGADQLASNAVVNASIASGASIDMDKLDGDSLGTAITDFAQDDLVILSDTSDSGNLVKITTSNFEDAIFGNISGDATVAAGGALTIANDAVEQAMIADDAVGADQLASNAVVTASIVDDQITSAKLGAEYTSAQAVTSAATITLDTSAYDVFTWTAGHTANIDFTNVVIGKVKTLVVTGGGSSYALTLRNINGSSGTFNLISGTYDDTGSTKNIIQVKFISTSEAWYTISKIAS